jgi:acyl carrier protein
MTLSNPDVTPENPDGGGNGRPPAEAAPPKRSPAEVQEWVVSYLARHLNTHPDEIDVTVPFEHFAVDSASAIEMTGHIEDWLGERVDPMMIYDYPTIRDMSGYLGGDGASDDGSWWSV